MGKDKVKVGLLGAGTIGSGVVDLFKRNGSLINEKIDFDLVLERVADRDTARLEVTGLEKGRLTTEASQILDDPSIDIVVELVGGIEPARGFVTRALENGKYVVTANKDLMASHGEDLLALARDKNVNLFYEAAVGGGIPLIRPLKYSLVADRVRRLVGIVNGTTNYIFTRMEQDKLSLSDALSEAQRLGFAESDPTNDIEGFDAVYKLAIMANLAFGKKADKDRVYVQGIKEVTYEDIAYAREIGYKIKLLAIGENLEEGLALRVHPSLVPVDHPLASVSNEFNAVFVEGEEVGELMFYGRGAGAKPTATAVLADVVEASRCLHFNLADGVIERTLEETAFIPIEQLSARFYLRFLAEDRAGVFAELANAFSEEKVSLDMIIQKRRVGNLAEIVLVTHLVREDAFQRALDKATKISAIRPNPSKIRLLG